MKLQNNNNSDELIFFLGDNGDGTGGYWKPEKEAEPVQPLEPFADLPTSAAASQPVTNALLPDTTTAKPTVLDWFKTVIDGVVDFKRAENGLPQTNNGGVVYLPSVANNNGTPPATDQNKWAIYLLVIVVVAMLAYLVFKKN